MFRELRRKEKETDADRAGEILVKGEYGVLSTVCENGFPYGVPLHYVYRNGSIYFHCAAAGLKTDNILLNDRVSFCVVGRYEVQPEAFSTEYESVVVLGRACEVHGEEKNEALAALACKYAPDQEEKGREAIRNAGEKTAVVKIRPAHICGKASPGHTKTAGR